MYDQVKEKIAENLSKQNGLTGRNHSQRNRKLEKS